MNKLLVLPVAPSIHNDEEVNTKADENNGTDGAANNLQCLYTSQSQLFLKTNQLGINKNPNKKQKSMTSGSMEVRAMTS